MKKPNPSRNVSDLVALVDSMIPYWKAVVIAANEEAGLHSFASLKITVIPPYTNCH